MTRRAVQQLKNTFMLHLFPNTTPLEIWAAPRRLFLLLEVSRMQNSRASLLGLCAKDEAALWKWAALWSSSISVLCRV